jgi:cell division protein FtsB
LSAASGPAGAAGPSDVAGASGTRRQRGPARPDSSRPVLLAAVLLFVILLGAAGLKSYRDLGAARVRERQLESRIEETRNGVDRLRVRIARLRSDPAMLERLAREDLGLVRREDVVIELPRGDRSDHGERGDRGEGGDRGGRGDRGDSGVPAAAPPPARPGSSPPARP